MEKGVKISLVLFAGCLVAATVKASGKVPNNKSVAVLAIVSDVKDKETIGMATLVHEKLSGKIGVVPLSREFDLLGGRTKGSAVEQAALEALFEEGTKEYNQFENQKAAELLRRVITGLEGALDGPKKWDLFVRAHKYLGCVLIQLGDKQGAVKAFQKVLRLRPEMELGPEFSTKHATLWMTAKDSLKTLPRGKLEVSSQPSGARIFLDGVELGKTPYSKDLPIGEYRILVSSPKLGEVERSITIGVGKNIINLDWTDSYLLLNGSIPALSVPDKKVPKALWYRISEKLSSERLATVTLDKVGENLWWRVTMIRVTDNQLEFERQGWLRVGQDRPAEAMVLADYLSGKNPREIRTRPVLDSRSYQAGETMPLESGGGSDSEK